MARVLDVRRARKCERQGCQGTPVATLTFVYADSTAVLGPVAYRQEPYAYDLCAEHAHRLKAPRGWEVIRLLPETQPAKPNDAEMDAIAEQVRRRGRQVVGGNEPPEGLANSGARYGHLRAVPSSD